MKGSGERQVKRETYLTRSRFAFDPSQLTMAAITLLEAIRQGLWEEMERDDRVFLLGEDIGVYGGAFKVTEGFVGRFGEQRVIDTPISESAIVGAACGAAMMGMRPVAEMQFIDFISCCFDILTNMLRQAAIVRASVFRWWFADPAAEVCTAGPSTRRTSSRSFSTHRA